MKPTPVICTDGKRHRWETTRTFESYGTVYKDAWCTKCGSLTEFFRKRGSADPWKRCYDCKKLYIRYPTSLVKKKRKRKEIELEKEEEI